MSKRIQLQHPQGKIAPKIDEEKYYQIRSAIITTLQRTPNLTFTQLTTEIKKLLAGKFEGSVGWYVVSVKLDLEARGEITRHPGNPETYTLPEMNAATTG